MIYLGLQKSVTFSATNWALLTPKHCVAGAKALELSMKHSAQEIISYKNINSLLVLNILYILYLSKLSKKIKTFSKYIKNIQLLT